jgi:hypothetical protein
MGQLEVDLGKLKLGDGDDSTAMPLEANLRGKPVSLLSSLNDYICTDLS